MDGFLPNDSLIRDSRERITVKKDNGFTDYAITTYLPPSEAIPDQLSTWYFQT